MNQLTSNPVTISGTALSKDLSALRQNVALTAAVYDSTPSGSAVSPPDSIIVFIGDAAGNSDDGFSFCTLTGDPTNSSNSWTNIQDVSNDIEPIALTKAAGAWDPGTGKSDYTFAFAYTTATDNSVRILELQDPSKADNWVGTNGENVSYTIPGATTANTATSNISPALSFNDGDLILAIQDTSLTGPNVADGATALNYLWGASESDWNYPTDNSKLNNQANSYMQPAVAINGDKVLIAYSGLESDLYYKFSSNGVTDPKWNDIATVSTTALSLAAGPTVVATEDGGFLICCINTSSGNNEFKMYHSTDGSDWSEIDVTLDSSEQLLKDTISIVKLNTSNGKSDNDSIYLFYSASLNGTYTRMVVCLDDLFN